MLLLRRFFSTHQRIVSAKCFFLSLRHAIRHLNNEGDIVISAQIAIAQGRNTLSFQTDFRIGLCSRLHLKLNLAVDRLRRKTAQKRGFGEYSCALSELDECIPSDVSVEKQFEAAQLAEMIEKWLDSLPREKRAVFILRYFYLKPVAEVASDLDITISKTAAILRRERISLQKTLEKEGVL